MEFPITKWIGVLKIIPALFFLGIVSNTLSGCASSAVSRDAANGVDSVYQSGNNAVKSFADDDLPSYPNYSSVALGAGAGGVAGAVAGALISGGTGVLPGAAGGAVVGGVMGGYMNNHANLQEQLENRGAKVFILGDQIKIILPSEQTFRGITPSIYPEAYPTLDMIAQLLNRYKTMQVKIAVYSDDAGSDKINASLSRQQSDALVKYYWGKINTRVLYGVGMGDCHLIDVEGAAANSRIEITSEKLLV